MTMVRVLAPLRCDPNHGPISQDCMLTFTARSEGGSVTVDVTYAILDPHGNPSPFFFERSGNLVKTFERQGVALTLSSTDITESARLVCNLPNAPLALIVIEATLRESATGAFEEVTSCSYRTP